MELKQLIAVNDYIQASSVIKQASSVIKQVSSVIKQAFKIK